MTRLNPSGGLRRFLSGGACLATVATGVMVLGTATPAFAENVLYDDSFAKASANGDWSVGGSTDPNVKNAAGTTMGWKPCLTAGDASTTGSIPACGGTPEADGALRLTDVAKGRSAFAVYQDPLKANRGASIEFDMYMYKSSTYKASADPNSAPTSADGISFFLIDGAKNVTQAGEDGGRLGYNKLEGAIIGVGFDEFGNFSNSKYFPKDKPARGKQPNNIVVRGDQAGGYKFITSDVAGETAADRFNLAAPGEQTRNKALRHVQVQLSTANILTVDITYNKGQADEKKVREIDKFDLRNIPGQEALPPTFKFGFGAATGSLTDYHEIKNLHIRSLYPNLTTKISHTGDFKAGGTGDFVATVGTTPTSGAPYGPISVSIPVKGAKVTGAEGDGWTCTTTEAQADCTRPGPDPDSFLPGTAFPNITIHTAVPASAPAQRVADFTVSATAIADTKDEFDPADNKATDTVTVKAPGPDLSTTVTPDGPMTSPGAGSYTAKVTNASGAGPTSGTTTETFTVPDGQTPTAATGDGWTCAIDGQKVTCTTDKILEPGSESSIKIDVTTIEGVVGPLNPSATVDTAGDTDPSNNTSPSVDVPIVPGVLGPDLSTTIAADGEITSPGTGSYTGVVKNDPAAGPTTGTTTETFTIPDGQTPTAATGDGWTCAIDGQKVTCTTDKVLEPGSESPIKIDVTTAAGVTGPLNPTATVDTPGDTDPSNNTAPPVDVPVTPAAKGPDLRTTVVPDGPVTAPGKTTYVGTVTNDAKAGPSTGPVTETFTVPDGQTPTKAAGDGWTCTIDGQKVVCTREDRLEPGDSFPPVNIEVTTAEGVTGPLKPTATVDTAGDTDPSNNTSPELEVPVTPAAKKPDLTLDVAADGKVVAGATAKLVLTVSDKAGAGPTTGPVTATYDVPEGSEVVSAAGDGWTCDVQRWKVVCTTDAVVDGGASLPPITLETKVCAQWTCEQLMPAGSVESGTDADLADNSFTTVIPVTRESDLAVTMTHDSKAPKPGDKITYTVTVTNNGPSDVKDADLGVSLPPGFDTTAKWTCVAAEGSSCPPELADGCLSHALLYVAAGGKITLTTTETVPAEGLGEASASVVPPVLGVTDKNCSEAKPCVAVDCPDGQPGSVVSVPSL